MTKEIIKLSALLLGLDDVVNHINNNTEASQDTLNKIDELIVFANYILREVTKEYFPLYTEEEVTSDNNSQIFFDKLKNIATAIKDIKQNSNSVTFNLYPTFIKVGKPNQTYNVCYSYIPKPIQSLSDELYLPLGLDYFVICYGIASEFALSKLLYSEADMWESKFKNSLSQLKSRVGERRFYCRRLK